MFPLFDIIVKGNREQHLSVVPYLKYISQNLSIRRSIKCLSTTFGTIFLIQIQYYMLPEQI